jgi:RNA polymerase sigma-70 factor (ECF subfamily)
MIAVLDPNAPSLESADGDLVLRYRAGDLGGLLGLYRRYSGPLYLYACSLTGDAARAEDLVQEAFVRLMSAGRDRLQESVRPFLYAIVRNLARDASRRSSIERSHAPAVALRAIRDDGVDPERLKRLEEAVETALEKLPAEQREAVVLKVYVGMTFDEIAEVVGVPQGTAISRYQYALKKLGDLLSDEEKLP